MFKFNGFLFVDQVSVVDAYRKALGFRKAGFFKAHGLMNPRDAEKAPDGRVPRYAPTAVEKLELLVNQRAEKAESASTSVGERITIARDYLNLTDAEIARVCGVSRELVRRWRSGLNSPANHIGSLSEILSVPSDWLSSGSTTNLAAIAHIGLRCGDEAMHWREVAFTVLNAIAENHTYSGNDLEFMSIVERSVFDTPEFAAIVRRAGGRWHVLKGVGYFVPWYDVQDRKQINKPKWDPAIEQMISDGLSDGNRTTVDVWREIQHFAQQQGLEYPEEVSLHKRVAKARQKIERFGLNLNSMISEAIQQYVV